MTSIAAIEAPSEDQRFTRELIRQLRAIDGYGVQDGWSDAQVLASVVLTKEQRREIPIVGDPDEQAVARVKAFHNAIAVRIELERGLMAVPVVQLTHEGFGRAFIIVGKLVALDRTLRDVHRFAFRSLAELEEQGAKLVAKALSTIDAFPAAAAA